MIDFPNSPTTGTTHTDGQGTLWEYTGIYWRKVRETEIGSYFGMDVLDEDDMASNRADALVTQQSLVAYIGTSLLDRTPINNVASLDTLTANDLRRLKTYSYDGAEVQVTVPTDTFALGDWFWLQSVGDSGIALVTTGLTVAALGTSVSTNGAMTIVFTGANQISVFGGEPA